MKFAVTIVSPPGYPHSEAFREVAETLDHGLRALGHDSLVTADGDIPGRRHIVLGCNLLTRHPIPLARDAILYNLEQVQPGSYWFEPAVLALLGQYTVWDYSERNAQKLEALGVDVAHVVPIGYVPQLTRIPPAVEQDIDVLFVGAMNPRRQAVIDQMSALGLKVGAAFGVYGAHRDSFLARAKLQLNVHHYDAKVLEMVRISWLLSNRLAVLSETGASPEEDAALSGGVAFAGYDELARKARALIDDPAELERLSRRGFEVMCARPVVDYLRPALLDLSPLPSGEG